MLIQASQGASSSGKQHTLLLMTLGILGCLNITDELMVACLDSDVVEPTPDELLELIWGH